MKTKILLFSYLKDIVRGNSVELELPDTCSAEEVVDYLIKEFPLIGKYKTVLRVAVDNSYMTEDEKFSTRAEIAIFPPVSGG